MYIYVKTLSLGRVESGTSLAVDATELHRRRAAWGRQLRGAARYCGGRGLIAKGERGREGKLLAVSLARDLPGTLRNRDLT